MGGRVRGCRLALLIRETRTLFLLGSAITTQQENRKSHCFARYHVEGERLEATLRCGWTSARLQARPAHTGNPNAFLAWIRHNHGARKSQSALLCDIKLRVRDCRQPCGVGGPVRGSKLALPLRETRTLFLLGSAITTEQENRKVHCFAISS